MKCFGLGEQLESFRRACFDLLIPRSHTQAGSVPYANELPRHRLGARVVACTHSLLGGLHHEQFLPPALT